MPKPNVKTPGLTFPYIDVIDEFAKSIGKTRDELSDDDKKQAVINAVLKRGEDHAKDKDQTISD